MVVCSGYLAAFRVMVIVLHSSYNDVILSFYDSTCTSSEFYMLGFLQMFLAIWYRYMNRL